MRLRVGPKNLGGGGIIPRSFWIIKSTILNATRYNFPFSQQPPPLLPCTRGTEGIATAASKQDRFRAEERAEEGGSAPATAH